MRHNSPTRPSDKVLQAYRDKLSYNPETGVFIWEDAYFHCLNGTPAGSTNARGYVTISINVDGVCIRRKAHQVAWFFHYGEWPSFEIDHRDGDPSNNMISNLRLATGSQNMHNRHVHKTNRVGVLGVTWSKGHKKYRADIKFGADRMYLGVFDTVEEARAARLAAEQKYHGEFAASNRPASDAD